MDPPIEESPRGLLRRPSKYHRRDHNKAQYQVQERAYISKMHSQYANDYATKAIDTNEKYLDLGESESELDLEPESEDEANEFQRIFGAEEDEEEPLANYLTEISRLDQDEAFQIDDSILMPIVKPRLLPLLVLDPRFLERFEWQVMLRVVVKSDIVTDEKNRLMRTLHGASETFSMLGPHDLDLPNIFKEHYKRNLWVALRAHQFGHNLADQAQILQYSRSLVDDFVEDIVSFKFDSDAVEKEYYEQLISEGAWDADKSVLEQPDFRTTLPLSMPQIYALAVVRYERAFTVVQELLDRYDELEQLWVLQKEMLLEKPAMRLPGFANKLDTIITWQNILRALYLEKASLIGWFKTQSLIRGGPDASDDVEHIARTCDINELDLELFAENLLAYKNVAEVMEKNIVGVVNPWVARAKALYLEQKEQFSELGLPLFLPLLLELARFPVTLVRVILRLRLEYAKNVSSQTLMGIDQTIYDFKVLIRLAFGVKESVKRFVTELPDGQRDVLERDLLDADTILLDMIDYLLVLLHRKLLDSSKSSHLFTTYKEPDVLAKEWGFLRNVGHFLGGNSGLKVLRSFLFLLLGLVERLEQYMAYQLAHPALENKLKFVKWYTTTFDNHNSVKRSLARLTNGAMTLVQNAFLLHHSQSKDAANFRHLGGFLQDLGFVMLTINGERNLHDHLYNRDAPSKATRVFYVFLSAEIADAPEEDIFATLRGTYLGADTEKPPIKSLAEGDMSPIKRESSGLGFFLVTPVHKGYEWKGKLRNIERSNLQLPKMVYIRHGGGLMIAHGLPQNLVACRAAFIGMMKRHYVERSEVLEELRERYQGEKSYEQLYEALVSLKPELTETGTKGLIRSMVQGLHAERACSILLVQKQLVAITRRYNKLLFTMLEKGLAFKDEALKRMPRDQDVMDIICNMFYVVRDSALLSLRLVDAADKRDFVLLMIRLSTDWIAVIVDHCAATLKRTFRWCVSALEFAVLVLHKFNVLLLTDEQFTILRQKVAGCLSLLILHFDIMGARSNKADKELYLYLKLQKQAIQQETSMAKHKYSELSEKIGQLEAELEAKQHTKREVGWVLDDTQEQTQFLTYLLTKFLRFLAKWQKGEYLGGGSFGSVYMATELTNGNVMAVKEMRLPRSADTLASAQVGRVIKDEMTVLEMLDHPNVVRYYGVEIHRDKVYLFMEYCDMGLLGGLLKHGKITEEKIIQWYTFQLVEGLAYLHMHNIVHRDIKPENILLTSKGVVKFVDFGAATVIASTSRSRSFRTDTGIVGGEFGTPMYMSPESIVSGGKMTPDSLGPLDVWALGCCVLEMATGRRPFAELDNEFAMMFHIAKGNKPELPLRDEMSPEGLNFLNRCFELRPEKRATADELLNDVWLAATRAEFGHDYSSESERE